MSKPLNRREQAEQRVRSRHERERARLVKERLADRRDLIDRHQKEIKRLDDLQARIGQRRKDALIVHDKRWETERAQLSSRTTTAPGFSLFGPPPRNLQKEYAERRERWEGMKDAICERYDEQLSLVRQQQQDLQQTHTLNLISHERWDRLTQDDLQRRQARSFEPAVQKEMARLNRSIGRRFERHARGQDRDR